MTFVTLFPGATNIHLTKDVGMIPFIMHKYYGYDSTLVCYKNDEYDYLETEVKGLKIDFLEKKTGNSTVDGLLYLIKNSRKIDVLHLFHISKRSFIWILVYKTLNPKGKVYLKLDVDHRIKEKDRQKSPFKVFLIKKILSMCKLVSVETKQLYSWIKENWNMDIEYIPNGFYDKGMRHNVAYDNKENIILTVGRIGTRQKATEILLKAFEIAHEKIPNWKLMLVGPIEEEFKNYVQAFFKNNPHLEERVVFTGPIYDRNLLDEIYRKSKIFCLPSRWESFGIVLVEALKNGCYIITSDIPLADDVTDNGKYGKKFAVDDFHELASLLVNVCNSDEINEKKVQEIQDFAYRNFYWPEICKKIHEKLNE
ncbi:MAG: hypothetical protein PWQ20_1847 [Thermotogaceae bacterium]|nr:hypothetical protein [Thermotogaceae bacterium]